MIDPEQLQRYAWADEISEAGGIMAWTLAVVTGGDRDAAIRAYGGDPEQTPAIAAFKDVMVDANELGIVSKVQVRQEGTHILMIENIGWLGTSDEEIAVRASSSGHFIAVHWDVESNLWMAEARNGELLASFDPLYIAVDPENPPPAPRQLPASGHKYPEWIGGVEFTIGSVQATLLAVVEQQTGLAFDRAWLDEPAPTYRIPYPGAAGAGKPSPVPV